MNYILQKANCKALIVALFVFVGALLSIRSAYAYDRVYIYTSGTFNLENTFISSSRGFLLTTDGEPTVRLLTSLPDTDRYYIYSKTSEAVPVVYASRFTGFLQAQADRLVNAIATGGVAGSGTLAVDLAPIITRLQAVTGRMDDILAQLQSTSGSATCEHTYSQHMEQEATCILPGLMISTCSKCGDSYSEIIDPLGHDWQCISHVEAVTDPDTGEETSSAYDSSWSFNDCNTNSPTSPGLLQQSCVTPRPASP